MGLAISVGHVAELDRLDPERADRARSQLDNIRKFVESEAGNGWEEPRERTEFDRRPHLSEFPYRFFHYLRRAYAWTEARSDESFRPVDGEAMTPEDERLVQEVALGMSSHLLCHSDCSGVYVPVDFEEPLFESSDRDLPGDGWVGSSYGLRRELERVAPLLDIELDDGRELPDEEAQRVYREATSNSHRFRREYLAFLALWEASGASIRHDTAIWFDGPNASGKQPGDGIGSAPADEQDGSTSRETTAEVVKATISLPPGHVSSEALRETLSFEIDSQLDEHEHRQNQKPSGLSEAAENISPNRNTDAGGDRLGDHHSHSRAHRRAHLSFLVVPLRIWRLGRHRSLRLDGDEVFAEVSKSGDARLELIVATRISVPQIETARVLADTESDRSSRDLGQRGTTCGHTFDEVTGTLWVHLPLSRVADPAARPPRGVEPVALLVDAQRRSVFPYNGVFHDRLPA